MSTMETENMGDDGRRRVVIENVTPRVDDGAFPVKRIVGDDVVVEADVFADGHDEISAVLACTGGAPDRWREVPMSHVDNDRWRASFRIDKLCTYSYTVVAWIDYFGTWRKALVKKIQAGQDIAVELREGVERIRGAAGRAGGDDGKRLRDIADEVAGERDYSAAVSRVCARDLGSLMDMYPDRGLATRHEREYHVSVDRAKARFSSWYELFPRSCALSGHGTLSDCAEMVPEIAKTGFDVLYLPPIHPIGATNRKGKDNAPAAGPDDPGSPWAIGSREGGHKSVHPKLGTLDDFDALVSTARDHGMEIALDLAFQCSPDHPYIREHPEWFRKRPDGTIQYAENPPKKYEDIVPLDFECANWRELWNELKSVVQFWMNHGVRIFRVDNPHTKAFPFWRWLMEETRRENPDILFLAEAFTRPKVMQRLAKIGFSQSYTYFTWRNTKHEIVEYITELTRGPMREYFRPNFWPNTPDILPEFLQYGGRPAFVLRLMLAATLSSNYGIYGPAFELCVREAFPGKEEYAASEKYELKQWDRRRPDRLTELIARINRIRKENPALQTTLNCSFCEIENDLMVFFVKKTPDLSNVLLVAANLDPFHRQSGWVSVPVHELGIAPDESYLVHDLITDDKYVWQGEHNYVELDPSIIPVHLFRLNRRLRRETDFDYYL